MSKKPPKKDPFFDPRCCTYRLSSKIRDHVEQLINSEAVESDTKTVLTELMNEDESNKNTLVYDSIVKLHKFISRADEEYCEPFYIFCEKCKCIMPKPRDNKQLDERLKLLRLRNSQSMYNKITVSVDRLSEKKVEKEFDRANRDNLSSNFYSTNLNNTDTEDTMSEFKKVNGSVVAVFNSFLVCICTFIFFYKALEYAIPTPNITAQVLFGLGGSTVVAIAELYFLSRVI